MRQQRDLGELHGTRERRPVELHTQELERPFLGPGSRSIDCRSGEGWGMQRQTQSLYQKKSAGGIHIVYTRQTDRAHAD
eukprot:scaffold19003_cov37-Phaeocystis_antarctica.AAC.2